MIHLMNPNLPDSSSIRECTIGELAAIAQEGGKESWQQPTIPQLRKVLKETGASDYSLRASIRVAKNLIPHFASMQQAIELVPAWKAAYQDAVVEGVI
jgi:hypothetical protein